MTCTHGEAMLKSIAWDVWVAAAVAVAIAFSVVAVVVLFGMLMRVGRQLTLTSTALALILGGAFGNLYDRIKYHYVIDFLEVHVVHYHWPDFNVADSCIVIGACLLLIEIFRPQART